MGQKSLKKDNRLYINWGIALLCCTLIFIAIEIRYPYFFLRDDNADSYLPEYMYGINCISEGKFPLYCFNTYCGQRFYAIGQTGIFNPLLYFAVCASRLICGKPDMMMDILAFMSILIGCSGAYFLLKRLGCSDLPAIIGAIAWNFNCYNIWTGTSWMIIIYTTSVFPFILLTSLLLLEKPSILNIILAVIPRVYLFYLGHPQFFIYAAIFDCIFIGLLCLFRNGADRWKKLLSLIKDYVIVYVSTTFLSLPLLVPQYEYTLLSYSNGEAGSYEEITNEMWLDKGTFYCPFLYTDENTCFFYPPFIGYLLFAFMILGFVLLIFILKKESKHRALGFTMAAAIPGIAIGYLLLFNPEALRVVSYIPILNRFHYYHRMNVFFTAFMIIFAALSMTATGKLLSVKCKKLLEDSPNLPDLIKYVVIVIEVACFGFLYTMTPQMGRGPLYDKSELYDYEFASQFTGGRYMAVGYVANVNTINSATYDLSENMNYNLAKLYRVDNVSGYAGVLNYYDVINYNDVFYHMYSIVGSVFEYYPGMVEQMREQSVCWYIINPETRDIFEPVFQQYGMQYQYETEN